MQSCRSLVFVGVHARRKDYKHHLKVMISGKLVTKMYFEDAMNYVQKKYRDDHVLFIMVSDDANWMKTMFSGSKFSVAFSSTAHGYCQDRLFLYIKIILTISAKVLTHLILI